MIANDRPGPSHDEPRATLALWDFRRQVADLYSQVRSMEPRPGWELWLRGRRELFASHPLSPIPQEERHAFEDLRYFPYDPNLRVSATAAPTEPMSVKLPHSAEGTTLAVAFAELHFEVAGTSSSLTAYWLNQYGGGVFLPFRDDTNSESTYGGGRYLLDSVKGADLGSEGASVVLDFNFSYHPSCFHDPSWSCPLAPPSNRLSQPIMAGERT